MKLFILTIITLLFTFGSSGANAFAVGQCLEVKANCAKQGKKTVFNKFCYAQNEVYKVESIKDNYLEVSTWYGFQNRTYQLLGYKEMKPIKVMETFTPVDCKYMKDKYPTGNFTSIY